jgi:hypothetical protein
MNNEHGMISRIVGRSATALIETQQRIVGRFRETVRGCSFSRSKQHPRAGP